MSNTAVVRINGIDVTVSLEQLLYAPGKDERLNSRGSFNQDNVGNEHEIYDGQTRNIQPNPTDEHDKDEYVVNKIVGHHVIDGNTMYRVCWYVYSDEDDTAEHIPSHIIKKYDGHDAKDNSETKPRDLRLRKMWIKSRR